MRTLLFSLIAICFGFLFQLQVVAQVPECDVGQAQYQPEFYAGNAYTSMWMVDAYAMAVMGSWSLHNFNTGVVPALAMPYQVHTQERLTHKPRDNCRQDYNLDEVARRAQEVDWVPARYFEQLE